MGEKTNIDASGLIVQKLILAGARTLNELQARCKLLASSLPGARARLHITC